jgi:hypothetical protein
MQQIIGIILLVSSFKSQATNIVLTTSEINCLKRNIYHEMRSEPKHKWHNVAKVALTRKKQWTKKQNFHAKSNHLCDIIKSKEYKSLATKHIKEPKIYALISQEVDEMNFNKLANNKKLFFTEYGDLK